MPHEPEEMPAGKNRPEIKQPADPSAREIPDENPGEFPDEMPPEEGGGTVHNG